MQIPPWAAPWFESAKPAERLRSLGHVSYSLYLAHWPVNVFARTTFDWSFGHWGTCVAVVFPLATGFSVSALMHTGPGIPAVADLECRTEARSRGCHGDLDDPILPIEEGLWRAESSQELVMLVGDSHAVSLSDAMVAAAHAAGLDMHAPHRSLCPFGDRPIKRHGCAEYQQETIARIKELQPDVLIVAKRAPICVVADENGEIPTNGTAAPQSWEDGQRSGVGALLEWVGIVIVQTVPTYGDAVSAQETISLVRSDGRSRSMT